MAVTKTKIAITIDTVLLKDIDRICKAEGRTRSAVIERGMREAVGESLAVVKALSNPVLAEAFANAFSDPQVLREMITSMGQGVSVKDIKQVEQAIDGVVGSLHRDAKKGGRGK